MKTLRSIFAAALLAAMVPAAGASAGDCTGYVVGVAPISDYHRPSGTGYLAVRTGPGSDFQKLGELYLGDEISVWERRGSWYHVACMSGRCTQPLWGNPSPRGWVYGRYLDVDGVCP